MCWKDPYYRSARRAGHAIATLAPVADHAGMRTAALPPDYAPDYELQSVIPAGVINGSRHSARYPWDWDDDPGPA